MAKRRKSNKKNNKQQPDRITVAGLPWGLEVSLPVPRLPNRIGSDLRIGPSQAVYPPMVKLDAPLIPNVFTVATGTAAGVMPLDITNISAFSTTFAALFREYCIVGARLELRYLNTASPGGLLKAYIDEKSNSAPTSASSAKVAGLDIFQVNSESPNKYHIDWKCRDYDDLDWNVTATTFTPSWLKVYTDANFLTPVGGAGSVYITGSLALCLRGYI
jgi:hypothetical protein